MLSQIEIYQHWKKNRNISLFNDRETQLIWYLTCCLIDVERGRLRFLFLRTDRLRPGCVTWVTDLSVTEVIPLLCCH